MNSFAISRLSIILLCLGGTLLLSPQSRAQSEVAPDHFDGTDSWAAAASAKAPASEAKPRSAASTAQARTIKNAPPALQPVAAHELVATRRSTALVTKKRKLATTSNN